MGLIPDVPTIDADEDIIDLQTHIGVELTVVEDPDIHARCDDPKRPEQFVLFGFEEYIYDAAYDAEYFHVLVIIPRFYLAFPDMIPLGSEAEV